MYLYVILNIWYAKIMVRKFKHFGDDIYVIETFTKKSDGLGYLWLLFFFRDFLFVNLQRKLGGYQW